MEPMMTTPLAAAPSRADLEELGLRMLRGAIAHGSASHARIVHPDPIGPLGAAIDGLEGFARSFELLGILAAGSAGTTVVDELEWYREGVVAGTDPHGADRWARLTEHPQAKVEAASIVLALDMTRPWIWDRLDSREQARVIDYLAPAVGDDTYPRINWVWFRLMAQTFLRSVGGPHSSAEMRADLATHDSFVRQGSWLADGSERAFDHYSAWALQTFPALWSRMRGAEDLAAERGDVDAGRLDAFLSDWLHLVGGDGSPLRQGRSLTYRFAAAAPFWAGALAETSHDPGVLRRAASRIVGYFEQHGAPDERGLLTVGWTRPWRPLAQAYSGPGSPLWAAKGLLGLALPADHQVWTAPERPLPVESGDHVRALPAPGWLISSTAADGVVRLANHGTDHSYEGAHVGDSPLYARLGYSTTTFPLLDDDSWWDPADQSVVILDAGGAATHRAGFRTDGVAVVEGCGVGASEATMHWLGERGPQQGHGYGYVAAATDAARVRVVSAARGAWEVRFVRVLEVLAPERCRILRISGWALDADDAPTVATSLNPAAAVVATSDLTSIVLSRDAHAASGTLRREHAVPTSQHSAVPFVDVPVEAGGWCVAAIALGSGVSVSGSPRLQLDDSHATVIWSDGTVTRIDLASSVTGVPGHPALRHQGRSAT